MIAQYQDHSKHYKCKEAEFEGQKEGDSIQEFTNMGG